eukprot:jgi/Mesen1/11077/ME000099S10507
MASNRFYTVLFLAALVAVAESATIKGLTQAQQDEYDVILSNLSQLPDQSTSLKYLNETGFLVTLAKLNASTLLSPVNDAYTKLPADIRSQLAGPQGLTVLAKVLSYHVVTQYKENQDLQATTSGLPTLLGPLVYTRSREGEQYFYPNQTGFNVSTAAKAIEVDVVVSGVHSVQGIDRVLIPTDISLLLPPGASAPAPAPASSAAVTPPAGSPPSSSPTGASPPSASPPPKGAGALVSNKVFITIALALLALVSL